MYMLMSMDGAVAAYCTESTPSADRQESPDFATIRYDTIRDSSLTCSRKPTRVSLIYRTETTTKKCKTEKLRTKNG